MGRPRKIQPTDTVSSGDSVMGDEAEEEAEVIGETFKSEPIVKSAIQAIDAEKAAKAIGGEVIGKEGDAVIIAKGKFRHSFILSHFSTQEELEAAIRRTSLMY